MLRKRRAIVFGTVALLCFALAACGGDGSDPTPTPTPLKTIGPGTATAAPSASPTPAPHRNEPPDRDLFDLAVRYRGLSPDSPRVARTEPLGYSVGDSETFTLFDLNGPTEYQVTATVQAITGHAYLFIENGAPYTQSALGQIADDFEHVVWARVTGAFGEPATPGVDGDPRITVLHAGLRGTGGYVISSDAYPREVHHRSNEREMIYLDSAVLTAPGAIYNDVAAHELQHLIHQNADDSEDAWLNEGCSQVAAQLVGGAQEWIPLFLQDPDLQLDYFPPYGDQIPHYAAGELFCSYLLDHYGGRENAATLINQPGDSFNGVEAYLADFTGMTFDKVFSDWVAANWLDAEEGPYSHPGLSARTRAASTLSVGDSAEGTVHQYAADYARIESGTFSFDGADEVTVGIPETDGAFWWSDRGDSIDSRLTREIDLTDVEAATLRYDAWYEIEEGWDYAYVAASTDDGATWTALPGQHTTTDDPVGNSYGPAYTGFSDFWVSEEIDLSAYAGSEVLIRFEYITDDSAYLTGFAVDNIEVPETGFADSADDAEGWDAEGFRTVDGPLRQAFRILLIGDDGSVTTPGLDSSNAFGFTAAAPVTVAVIATTRGTTELARYSWTLSP